MQVEVGKQDGVKVLSAAEIRKQLETKFEEWEEFYGLYTDQMILVARHYAWAEHRFIEWFDLPESVHYEIGFAPDPKLQENPQVNLSVSSTECLSCYEELSDSSFALECQHKFCNDCWLQYLTAKVQAGDNQCTAPCLQDGCNMVVTHSVFIEFLNGEAQEQYWRNLCRAYTNEDKSIRWCVR